MHRSTKNSYARLLLPSFLPSFLPLPTVPTDVMYCTKKPLHIQVQAHVLPHAGHLRVGAWFRLRKSSRSSVGSSFQERRYFMMVRFENSWLHPPQSQIFLMLHLHLVYRNWHPPRRNEWVPYGAGSTPMSRRLLRKFSRNIFAGCNHSIRIRMHPNIIIV